MTRQAAPSAWASAMARRLSSIAAARPAASAAGNMPPRQRPVTVSPASRICRAAAADAHGLQHVAPGRDAGDAVAGAALDAVGEAPAFLHRDGVEAEGTRGRHATPCTASSDRMRGCRHIRIGQQPRGIGQPEQLGKMLDAAGGLLAADHGEVGLVAVQPGHEDHAGLVEAGRRLEDMPAQRHGRRQDGVEAGQVVRGQRRQRPAHRRRDRIEDAEQRVGMALRVAGDQFRVVEVVAGVHAHAARQAPAHGDLLLLVEQADLHAIHLGGAVADDGERRLHRLIVVGIAPVAVERGVEHLAQPVDDHRLLHLAQDAGIDAFVIRRAARRLGQRARGHQDDAAAHPLDRRALFLVGADDVVDRHVRRRAPGGRCRRRSPSPRRACPAWRRGCGGSAPAPPSNRGPCRAARCPSLPPRRGRATRGAGGRRWCGPSRPWRRARGPARPAGRPRHARRRARGAGRAAWPWGRRAGR